MPRCLDWFDRINREAAAQKYPTPRYWEPVTNRPLYVPRTGEFTAEGYGKYLWTTDPAKSRCDNQPCKWQGKPIVDVTSLRTNYKAIAALVYPRGARRAIVG